MGSSGLGGIASDERGCSIGEITKDPRLIERARPGESHELSYPVTQLPIYGRHLRYIRLASHCDKAIAQFTHNPFDGSIMNLDIRSVQIA